jgi:hypothetical protein
MTDDAPATDARHPADVVVAMVEHVLGLAATWTRWDGTPAVVQVEGEPPRTYTPHKAVRRVADHLLDHLAPFTADDLDEARSRLQRLVRLWDLRLRTLPAARLDQADDGAWTLRQVAFHVAGSDFYADAVGDLSTAAPQKP